MTASARTRAAGIAIALAGAVSAQSGAAFGSTAFAAVGPIGVVAVRQLIAAAVLLPVARPPVRSLRWSQWWPCLALGGVLSIMNFGLYSAIERLGLGLAVTLEFLGPLTLALLAGRRLVDAGCAVLALVGIAMLLQPGPSSDVIGIGAGLLAAAGWAAYILLGRMIGQRLPGLQGPALATATSAATTLPILMLLWSRFTPEALLAAVVAGVLSSAIPASADVMALRRLPTSFFGVFMSTHPLIGALIGFLALGQALAPVAVVGIALVALANAVAVGLATLRRSAEEPAPTAEPAMAPIAIRAAEDDRQARVIIVAEASTAAASSTRRVRRSTAGRRGAR
jgi:inner membrane transporter RhtA